MELEFAFVAGREFNFLHAFAKHFDLPVVQNQVIIPPAMGSGYLKQIRLDNGVNLSLHDYQLRQTLVLKRLHSSPHESLIFRFSGSDALTTYHRQQADRPLPGTGHAVQVASSNLFAGETFPAHTEIKYWSLSVSPQHLLELLALDDASRTRWNLLTDRKAFVLYEAITPEMSRILAHLTQLDERAPLALLRGRIKVQELLYLLFSKILARASTPIVAVRQAEAEKILAVERAVLTDLSSPPHLPTLARQSGLSGTKLKQLFRQVFGASVYDYYQVARLKEAARLLRSLSVAETGYMLGFTNLSHFARLFEKHHQVKPKKYQAALGLALPNEPNLRQQ